LVVTEPDPHGISLVRVGPENLDECGIGCLTNPKHEGFEPKVRWLRDRFDEGLRYLLFRNQRGKPLAFLEYVPGEFAWRPVRAEGWLFVHCLWVYSAGKKVGGLGSRLVQACIEEARQVGAIGVAAFVRDGPWMAGKRVFEKNGFEVLDVREGFELVCYRLGEGPDPAFRNLPANLKDYDGLHVVYSAQCPMLPKSVNDLAVMAAEHGLTLSVTELQSADEAQAAPTYYGVFNLIWNGRLLSDHYVSRGRFKGLLRREILS
jgi:hypothetical protein